MRSNLLGPMWTGAVCLLFAVTGCTGAVGGNPPPGATGASGDGTGASSPSNAGASSSTGGSSGDATTCDAAASLATARVWRLTDGEYVNVVQAVFGVAMPPEISQAQVNTGDFTNFSEGAAVGNSIALSYQKAAHEAALQAVTSHLKTFLPCGVQSPSDACVEQFVRNRVSRAFGRPVTEDEVQGLMTVYRSAGIDGPLTGIQLVIEAVLQSGSFLYRTELGAPTAGGPIVKTTLTPFEIASALSFTTLDSAPDEELWAAAENGSLTDPKVLAAQVERLLALPVTQGHLGQFANYWLGVEKLPAVSRDLSLFPEFTEGLKADLYTSAKMFVQDVFAHGTVKDLLTSRRMYLNESLAKVYGVSGVTGSAFTPVDVNSPERAGGILTQPAVLAATDQHPDKGDVVHRGLFIYRSLVCGATIGDPPGNALALDAALPPNSTERARAEYRAANVCRVCHAMFDPFGLATEKYDPIGRYTPNNAMGSVDSSSTISDQLGPNLAGPISGLPDMIAHLQKGQLVSDCAVANLAQMSLGRQVQHDTSCAIKSIKDQLASSGSFKDFYRALLTSPGFITRDPAPPASTPAPGAPIRGMP